MLYRWKNLLIIAEHLKGYILTEINKVFDSFAAQNMQIRQEMSKNKTQHEEIKELLQNPQDPLAKYPLRGFGYANEIGASLSAMPGWGKTAEALLWVPALMYLGADIYDKYSRGKEGNYSKPAVDKAVEQAAFQALAGVILPTSVVKIGQRIAGFAAKYDGSHLTASAQEELYKKLLNDFDKGRFAKSDYKIIAPDGSITVKNGIDKVIDDVLTQDYEKLLNDTAYDLKTESFWSKIKRFFTHATRPVASATSNRTYVTEFLTKRTKEIFELQNKLEIITEDELSKLKPGILKRYNKASKNIDEKAKELIKENPSFVLKKILNSYNPKMNPIAEKILEKYKGDSLKLLLTDNKSCSAVLDELFLNAETKTAVLEHTKKVKAAHDAMRLILKAKGMRLGWLKTAGGLITLASLAIPIDHFVHKYIIQKAVAPAIENVEKLNKNFK